MRYPAHSTTGVPSRHHRKPGSDDSLSFELIEWSNILSFTKNWYHYVHISVYVQIRNRPQNARAVWMDNGLLLAGSILI
jgi:hypothetical protein